MPDPKHVGRLDPAGRILHTGALARPEFITMRLGFVASAPLALFAIAALAAPEKPQQIRAEGCVEPGPEARCLLVRDVRTSIQYEVFVKGVQPAIGTGIEFIGVPHHGMTTCAQGNAVDVQRWVRKDLKCTQGTAPKPRH